MLFKGIVVSGEQVARGLGYPTANIDLSGVETGLSDGVYAAWVFYLQKKYPAAFIVQAEKKKWEAHILDAAGLNLYGQDIAVEVVKKVSEIVSLPIDKLLVKINEDVEMVRTILS
jgi:riboflavin kinase/FMN adenylyltransferase